MGKFHKKHWRGRRFDKHLTLKVALVAVFLFFAYLYYTNNVLDLGFATMILIPLIKKMVEGYIYWIVAAVLSFCIWKGVDYFY